MSATPISPDSPCQSRQARPISVSQRCLSSFARRGGMAANGTDSMRLAAMVAFDSLSGFKLPDEAAAPWRSGSGSGTGLMSGRRTVVSESPGVGSEPANQSTHGRSHERCLPSCVQRRSFTVERLCWPCSKGTVGRATRLIATRPRSKGGGES